MRRPNPGWTGVCGGGAGDSRGGVAGGSAGGERGAEGRVGVQLRRLRRPGLRAVPAA